MADLEKLIALLNEDSGNRVIVAIGTFPRKSETGFLEEQGRIIDGLREATFKAFDGSKAFRILWTQIVFLFNLDAISPVQKALQEILRQSKTDNIEIRAVIAQIKKSFPVDQLDSFMGEVTAKWNFGSQYSGNVVRIIDGDPWFPLDKGK